MRFGIVTDSCCDLPRSFLDEHGIVILPITITGADGKPFVDGRDTAATLKFYKERLAKGDTTFESAPLSADDIKKLFLERLVVEYDYVFCLTVMASRSLIHANASQAALQMLGAYKPLRESAGVAGPFSLRVFDSYNLFTGQGLIVAEAARLAREDKSSLEIIRQIERLQATTQAFLIPENLGQLRQQARRKGDKSVGLMSYMMGSALDIKPIVRGFQGDTTPVGRIRGFEAGCKKLFDTAVEHIQNGLDAPFVCVSYGGDPARLDKMPGYARLKQAAEAKGVTVLASEMSLTAGVNIGGGGLSVAFASPREAVFE
ncbi:DegV family protein [Amantichitinum ursilacus]|uniref:DegV domain-containing protein n=1 Tax=Amantichitinum ursilacus TaxID=857265 RepID=A0A0N0GMT4_9NEIS|nr:DegV family protein [Amantichitinum ursilacus]KPC52071.1 DegV domain-containing protein [Amantichitinum ursilacus]